MPHNVEGPVRARRYFPDDSPEWAKGPRINIGKWTPSMISMLVLLFFSHTWGTLGNLTVIYEMSMKVVRN
jgi:hypothetical protein